jgi:hypothetical protein
MNSDGDKIYMKIVAFDEIYNFVVSTFFIWSHLVAKKTIYYPDLNFRYPDLGSISFFSGLKMTFRYPDLGSIWFFPFSSWVQMKKSELQSYTSRRKIRFLYKFVSIQVHKRKLRFFGNVLNPSAVWYDGWRCSQKPYYTAVGTLYMVWCLDPNGICGTGQ